MLLFSLFLSDVTGYQTFPYFLAPIKYVEAQFYPELSSIRLTDRHFRKNRFLLTQGVSKRKYLIKISKVIFHIKLIIPSHSFKEFENLSVEKKTLSTALGFEPRFFDCRSTE